MNTQHRQERLPAEIADETTKNISLAGEFLQAVLDDPTLLEQIPNHATIVFIPENDLTQTERNLVIANDAAREGRDVWLVHLGAGVTAVPMTQKRREVG